eukprot:CAMPEP_0185700974 /NCGR_PEP_ID=MMETSP1164-20130828/8228_1 /TAXON_ID=1104430 /ORGANISM="Chrysoreinhardia sp, Strain CCMP2950" /LENGTH=465 /DNA_ID=CAMNT_0028367945 /DNA_START=337 /DNA_END=1731 /DNA_ORIENTATION=+
MKKRGIRAGGAGQEAEDGDSGSGTAARAAAAAAPSRQPKCETTRGAPVLASATRPRLRGSTMGLFFQEKKKKKIPNKTEGGVVTFCRREKQQQQQHRNGSGGAPRSPSSVDAYRTRGARAHAGEDYDRGGPRKTDREDDGGGKKRPGSRKKGKGATAFARRKKEDTRRPSGYNNNNTGGGGGGGGGDDFFFPAAGRRRRRPKGRPPRGGRVSWFRSTTPVGRRLAAAARLVGVDLLPLGDVDLGLRGRGRLRLHPLSDLARHGGEGLLDVGRVLRRGLEVLDAQRVGELLGLLGRHGALRGEVALVAHEKLLHVLARVAVDLVEPLLDVVERLEVRHVEDDDDAVRAAVVRRRDRPEPLLTRGVPDLQLDRLALELDRPDLEVHPDGRDVRLGVRVIGEAQQKARLPDARVPDEEQLEEVVVLRVHGGGGGASTASVRRARNPVVSHSSRTNAGALRNRPTEQPG